MHLTRIALLAAALVPVAGNALQTSRDSAGVRITESAKPLLANAAAMRIAPTPTLIIGTQASAAYEFSHIAGAGRLADGSIVVADGASKQLRFFDAKGTHIRTRGGPGAGPGEFQELDFMRLLAGDTIVAGSGMRTLSYFAANGNFAHSATALMNVAQLPPGIKPVMGVFDDQSALVAVASMRPQAKGRTTWVEPMPLFIVDRAATKVQSLGDFPAMQFTARAGEPSPPWFGAIAAIATRGSRMYIGYGAEYSIRVFTQTGQLERIVRRAWTPKRVTRADIDAYVTEWAKLWIKPGPNAQRELDELRTSSYAEIVPAFSQIIVDRTHRMWVREPNLVDAPGCGCLDGRPTGESTWSVFDAEGRWLNDVRTPARFSPLDIGANYVLGIARDDDGVQTIAMYALIAPR